MISKKKKRTILKERLDDIVRDEILAENPFCFLNPNLEATEVHHFLHGRTNTKYRWDKRNLLPINRKSHRLAEDGKISQEEVEGKALYYDLLTIEELEEIKSDSSINKIYDHEIEDMIKEKKK